MKHAIFLKQRYSQGGLCRRADIEGVDDLIQDKLC